MVLICLSLMISDLEHFFLCLLSILMPLFEKWLLPIFNWVIYIILFNWQYYRDSEQISLCICVEVPIEGEVDVTTKKHP
jgi:hypothetical protein